MVIPSEEIPQLAIEAFMRAVPDGCSPGTHQGGLVAALAMGISAWEELRKPDPVISITGHAGPHDHQWRNIGAKSASALGIAMYTSVLQKCAGCGVVLTVQLQGVWTLEEVNAL